METKGKTDQMERIGLLGFPVCYTLSLLVFNYQFRQNLIKTFGDETYIKRRVNICRQNNNGWVIIMPFTFTLKINQAHDCQSTNEIFLLRLLTNPDAASVRIIFGVHCYQHLKAR